MRDFLSLVNTPPGLCVLQAGMVLGFGTTLPGTTFDSRLSITDRRAVTSDTAHDSYQDSALVLAAREGDRRAFGQLYAKYARMIHGVLLARVPPDQVDDLVQDVFLRALPRIRDLRQPERFGPWLCAIARNIANDYYRQTKPVSELTESLSDEGAQEPAERGATSPADTDATMILRIVRGLSETYRETLILRLVEGMTGPEIAARTGLTPGSVRVNLHRGMQQLRERLAQGLPSIAVRGEKDVGKSQALRAKSTLHKRNEP